MNGVVNILKTGMNSIPTVLALVARDSNKWHRSSAFSKFRGDGEQIGVVYTNRPLHISIQLGVGVYI